jgi:hypothetical protein
MTTRESKQPPYEGTTITGRYMWWVAEELGHPNPNIDAYVQLLISEFARLTNNEITIEEFDKNTPNIEDETPLNYIQGRIVTFYPN